jgi:hypothetical protein
MNTTIIENVVPRPIVKELPLPFTLPTDTKDGFEMMRVVEDMNDDIIHVELAPVMDNMASWGIYLGRIARAIARDYPEIFRNHHHGDAALALIRAGFDIGVEDRQTETV